MIISYLLLSFCIIYECYKYQPKDNVPKEVDQFINVVSGLIYLIITWSLFGVNYAIERICS